MYYFATVLMVKKKKTYSVVQLVSAVFMILALLWLTVSTPFVFAAQQQMQEQNMVADSQSPLPVTEDETGNPFGSTTEEKAPSSTSLSEEYLHDHHSAEHFFIVNSPSHKCENADTYNAFHGELLVPPPNRA